MQRPSRTLSEFRLEIVIEELKYLLLNELHPDDDLRDIEWILRVLLMSKDVFPSVKEVDNFLSNITGFTHDTRSTGRDRIVDWYFKRIQELDIEAQNQVLYRLSKYLFTSISSNYSGWKRTLYRRGNK